MEIILEERRIKIEKNLILITKSSGFSDHENVFFLFTKSFWRCKTESEREGEFKNMLKVFIAFKSQRFSEKKRVFEPEHVDYMIVFLRLLSLISFYFPV